MIVQNGMPIKVFWNKLYASSAKGGDRMTNIIGHTVPSGQQNHGTGNTTQTEVNKTTQHLQGIPGRGTAPDNNKLPTHPPKETGNPHQTDQQGLDEGVRTTWEQVLGNTASYK